MKLKRLLKIIKEKINLFIVMYVFGVLLYMWAMLSLYCMREMHTIADSQMLVIQSRLRIAIGVCGGLVVAASVVERIRLRYLRGKGYKTSFVAWKQKLLYTEVNKHIVNESSYAEFADTKKRYVSECLLNGKNCKIRNFEVYGVPHYDVVSKRSYIAKEVFSLIIGMPVKYPVYMRQTQKGLRFTAYTFLFADNKDMVYYVRKLPVFIDTVDIFAYDTRNESVKDKNAFLRSINYTDVSKKYFITVLLFLLWLYLAILLFLHNLLWLAVIQPLLTALLLCLVKELYVIGTVELQHFYRVMQR